MNISDKHAALAGLRLLIVEDEMLVAMLLEDLLGSVGCEVVKAPNVAKALALIESEQIDGALLDVNLHGGRAYPVATELKQRDIPFVFTTGYDENAIDECWRDRPVLRKPFTLDELEPVVALTFAATRR